MLIIKFKEDSTLKFDNLKVIKEAENHQQNAYSMKYVMLVQIVFLLY